jgi:hypothetical protein
MAFMDLNKLTLTANKLKRQTFTRVSRLRLFAKRYKQ